MFLSTRNTSREPEHGFTLIELLVVVVILGVLIAIAIPVYLNYRRSANDKASQSDVRGAVLILEQCYNENGIYPTGATIAGSSTAGATGTVCAGRTTGVSAGTTLKWFLASDSQNYIVGATNANGTGKNFCYHSAQGGAVKDYTTAVSAWRSAC